MDSELGQILKGLILFAILVGLVTLFTDDVTPDLSSDFEETQGQFYEGGGGGHPLYNN